MVIHFAPNKNNQRSQKNKQFEVATNFFDNNQHVKFSLITLTASAVWTIQQYPNVIKFHGARLRPVSEKSGTRTNG